MKKVVFLSWHYYNSKRKAGFHFLAKSLKDQGYQVVFVTSVVSFLTYFKKDKKIYEESFNRNTIGSMTFDGVKSVINFSVFQPPISRKSILLEFFARIFFKLGRASSREVRGADYVVFESLASIRFFDKIKSINGKAKLIYRVSDDMEALNVSEATLQCEKRILDQFDLVSVPTKIMYDKFSKLSPNNVKLHFHGINKDIYDNSNVSPYTEKINHIFVGNSHLDHAFIEIASSIFCDHYFHIIGDFEPRTRKDNVIYYGHMRFEDTVPYIKFASTGLQIRSNEDGVAKTLSDSLKVLQYSYSGLPIIAPSVIPAFHRENFFYYEYDDEQSIRKCITQSLTFCRTGVLKNIGSWDELAFQLMND